MAAQTFNEALEARAKLLIQQEINALGKSVSAGLCETHADYKYNCGIIKGLQKAGELMEAALREITEGQRGR